MNKEEILAMKAGAGLDALVAKKVMGWVKRPLASGERWYVVDNGTLTHSPQSVKEWKPSTDISAAWEVVEKFYYSDIRKLNGCNWGAWVGRGDGHSSNITAVTAPEAICKAALLSVMDS